ncbi:MAG: arginine--tRNA ligase [Candidatus Bipolaricaulota bacterium]|nr:MAG: arginine--tRNA ligase [Candidatus Bipolaricaulota bacterium]
MLRRLLQEELAAAWRAAGLDGDGAWIEVTRSERPEFGDFTSNVALAGAKRVGESPRALAEQLAPLVSEAHVERVEIAGPGFLNLFLRPGAVHRALREMLDAGDRFARSTEAVGTRLQLEYVSSNPTGPLTVGHGRQGVLGDVLASLYEALGFDVEREYYYNDAGRQVDLLAESLWARYRQVLGEEASIPDEGYQGEYLISMAESIAEELGDRFPEFDDEARRTMGAAAVERMTESIRGDLDRLGLRYDHWFSETTLHASGEVDAALASLTECGGTYEKDGAVWLAAEERGGDRDAVLIRSDGRPTYLMVDIAYHLNKHRRGFDRVIDVQGADHHAEQNAMRIALAYLGIPEGFLDYALHQFVSLKSSGEALRMSTRKGRFVTLGSLLDELGRDIVRYFMVARKPSNHLEFDLDLARSESLDNPATYIQYAHTRIASILRNAPADALPEASTPLDVLAEAEELELIKDLDGLPDVIHEAATSFSPHLIAEYALNVSRRFHAYYTEHRVLGDDAALTAARLALVLMVQRAIRCCLDLLGMSAPETM